MPKLSSYFPIKHTAVADAVAQDRSRRGGVPRGSARRETRSRAGHQRNDRGKPPVRPGNVLLLRPVNATLALSLFAVVVSVIALPATTVLTLRQIKLVQNSHYIPVVELIAGFRRREFYDDLVYVTDRLRSEHDPALGISGLPGSARSSLLNIAY